MASLMSPWVIGQVIDFTGNFNYVWWILAAGPLLALLVIVRVYEERVH
jgi:cyanate permease